MKNSVLIEGRNYISSRRGAEITKYTNDYIGQLCRAGKIDSRMVGRSWFVEEQSLLEYKKEADKHFGSKNGVTKFADKSAEKEIKKDAVSVISDEIGYKETSRLSNNQVDLSGSNSSIDSKVSTLTEKAIPSIKWDITYTSDNSPLLPILRKDLQKKLDDRFVVKESANDDLKSKAFTIHTPTTLKGSNVSNASKIGNILDASRLSGTSNTSNVIGASNTLEASKSFGATNISKLSGTPIVSPFTKRSAATTVTVSVPKHHNLKKFKIAVSAFVVILFLGAGIVSFLSQSISESSQQLEAGVFSALSNIISNMKERFSGTLALFTGTSQLSMNSPVDMESGVVVAPSAGKTDADAKFKEKVINSFSDQVEIHPDVSGTAGVITPLFREAKGKDFVYVMVPVKKSGEAP